MKLRKELPSIQKIGKFGDDDTPFDMFDSKCHNQQNGIIKGKKILKEDDIILMINVAEHVKRPTDMLMFLGEYFKVVVEKTENIAKNI
jgi:hypothetical protein